MPPSPPAAFDEAPAVEVEVVDGVLTCVVVVVGAAAWLGVDLEEAAQGRVVQAHAHQDQARKGVGGALLAAQPAVAGGRAAGSAELVGVQGGPVGGGQGRVVGGAADH